MEKKECLLQAGWYLLKTKTHQESIAFLNLTNQGFDAYNPKVLVRKGKNLKTEIMFPGYVFLALDLQDLNRYHKIRSTRGVTELVYFNRITRALYSDGRLSKVAMENTNDLLPKPIPDGDDVIKQIKKIIQTMNDKAEGKAPTEAFYKGDKVIMNNDLYRNLEMTFIHNLGSQRGMILVQYIKEVRTPEGKVSEVVSEQTLNVKITDLEKA